MRIYEMIKELNIDKNEALAALSKIGVSVKSTTQSVSDDDVNKVKEMLTSGNENMQETPLTEENTGVKVEESVEASDKTDSITAEPTPERPSDLKLVKVPMGATVKEFAELIKHPATEVIKHLVMLGEMLTINQQIGSEAAGVVAEEFGYRVEMVMPDEVEAEKEELEAGTPEPRPPVVTVMGHVDHGKTSLLDAFRKSDVISGEAGGITQHIGAYTVTHNEKPITFIDTPGHESFTAMRARGASVTDIAVLVVAADDGVKAQTVEAIDHARAAGVPIVVAINKIDKPEANPDKVRKELSDIGLVPEDWGGNTVFVEVSAKQNINLNELLEMIQLVADIGELKAPKDVTARGVAIEAKLDKGRGPVATVLVQRGVLKIGNIVIAGSTIGRVRALIDDKGRRVKEAGPSQPVEILGLSAVPNAGDELLVVADERKAKQIAEARQMRDDKLRRGVSPTIEFAREKMGEVEAEELRLIVKADVHGSLEAIVEEVTKLSREDVKVNVIHKGVGAITETDVMLAAASSAIIIGFNVRPDVKSKEMAESEGVQLRLHRVIYQVIEDVRSASIGLLKPQIEEEDVGIVEVRETFKVPKIGFVAGCFVTDGEVSRGSLVRLVRDGVIIYDGKIASLRRFKEDVQNVKAGYECGIGLENYKDVKEGDILEVYKNVEKPRE